MLKDSHTEFDKNSNRHESRWRMLEHAGARVSPAILQVAPTVSLFLGGLKRPWAAYLNVGKLFSIIDNVNVFVE